MAERLPDHGEVAVVGGGPVGAALALALRGSGLRVLLLEAREPARIESDPRTLVLSHGSRLLLERLGVWDRVAADATPIESIHVSQPGFGRSWLAAGDMNLAALGYVVAYSVLHRTLLDALSESDARLVTGAAVQRIGATGEFASLDVLWRGESYTVTARLAALADGGRLLDSIAPPRTRDYRQRAVVANVETSLPHRNVAYERFDPAGPLALLPLKTGSALVWSVPPERASELCALDDAVFLARLQAAFGDRLGSFTRVGSRADFPLLLKWAPAAALPRTALVGNAAQTLHPVAGQGLNLGLRDAWVLAEEILRCSPEELGGPAMLSAYRRRRRLDRDSGIFLTDSLVRLFSSDFPGLRASRALGFVLFDALPPVKKFLMRRMIFGAAR